MTIIDLTKTKCSKKCCCKHKPVKTWLPSQHSVQSTK